LQPIAKVKAANGQEPTLASQGFPPCRYSSVCVGRIVRAKLPEAIKCLSARVVVAAVRGYEHRDGRSAIGFDFVVVLCARLIEAYDIQEIGSFEKRGKQAGGL
jgi:hypothetical protein